MSKPTVTIVYNKANTYGLLQDVKLLESVLCVETEVRIADPLEHPKPCDLVVHMEVPYYGWMAWGARNVVIVNPEWWESAWNPYLAHVDALIFKCTADKDTFMAALEALAAPKPKAYVIPWTCAATTQTFALYPKSDKHSDGILWLLGASVNKRAAAAHVIPLWKPTYPPLVVYTTTPLTCVKEVENVAVNVVDLSESGRYQVQSYHPCHMIVSAAEALGVSAHEGQAAGAFLIGNALPAYMEAFDGCRKTYLMPATLEPYKGGVKDTFAALTAEALDAAIKSLMSAQIALCRTYTVERAEERKKIFISDATWIFKKIFATAAAAAAAEPLPPSLGDVANCPPISIITLLHNRRKFVDLCFHNLMITDYPKDKIEWVVIEDSDIMEEQAADKILKFAHTCAPMNVSYIPLEKKNVPIGAMRNRAVKKALHDVILFMDDDDHYPPPSFSRRVAWLLKHPWQPEAVACTTIACYDLVRGVSAVNTPPWSLPLKQRISEATLTFKKSWWEAQRFPKVSMAEGEGFLEGREGDVVELQPQQIIVAMTHGKNASSRRFPEGPASCFWGFPKEFLVFLHRLAGVEVDAD